MKSFKKINDIVNKYSYILNSKQKRLGIIVLFLTMVGAFFETLGVSVILPLVQVMIDPSQLLKNDVVVTFLKIIKMEQYDNLVWIVGILIIITYMIKNLYLFILSYVRVKFSCRIQRELSIEMMSDYLKRGYCFFSEVTVGELLRGMRDSITSVYEGMYQILKLFAELFTVICICVYVMVSDWMMAICVICLSIICLLLVMYGFKKWTQSAGKIVYIYDAMVNKTLLQTFQGIKEVLVMKRQDYFKIKYKNEYMQRQKGIIWKTVSLESPAFIIEALCVTGMISMVCVKTVNNTNNVDMVPQLAAFAVAAFRILPSLGRISSSYNTFVTCIPGINETYENFFVVREKECEHKVRMINMVPHKEWRYLRVEDVSWNYPNNENKILNKVNLKIEKGTSIALVGSSGAGKTTLADIILGLYDLKDGRVCLDDIDMRYIDNQSADIIGFVPQNVYLLNSSVKCNIAFGLEEFEIDDDRVWRAIEKAQLMELVMSMPQGIDTEIGESGMRLSGGQRQRIAIARALYYDPEILVFDEATSALDTETETAIMESIHSLKGEKTMIIIAHRISTIKDCDVIYRVENGKVYSCVYEELIG